MGETDDIFTPNPFERSMRQRQLRQRENALAEPINTDSLNTSLLEREVNPGLGGDFGKGTQKALEDAGLGQAGDDEIEDLVNADAITRNLIQKDLASQAPSDVDLRKVFKEFPAEQYTVQRGSQDITINRRKLTFNPDEFMNEKGQIGSGEKRKLLGLALQYLRRKYPKLQVDGNNLSFGAIDTRKGKGEIFFDAEEIKAKVEELPPDEDTTDPDAEAPEVIKDEAAVPETLDEE